MSIVQWITSINSTNNFKTERFIDNRNFCLDEDKFLQDTTVKTIGIDEINFKDKNIFPIRFVNNDDHIFKYTKYWPLNNIDNSTLIWLQNNPKVIILYHDIREAKPIKCINYCTIPGIFISYNNYNLKNKIIYLTGDVNIDNYKYKKVWTVYPELIIKGTHNYFQNCIKLIKKSNNETLPFDLNKNFPKFTTGRFLFYCNRPRLSRLYLGNLLTIHLKRKLLFTKILVNNNDSVKKEKDKRSVIDSFEYFFYTYNDFCYNKNDLNKIVSFFKKTPINTFPEFLQTDTDEKKLIGNIKHYKHIFIEIICETYNENCGKNKSTIFLTEKIAKPLYYGRPFIVSANPGYYDYLKYLGFKTFDKWWPEDFNNDISVKNSYKIIMEILQEIASWDIKQCIKVYKEMIPVLRHNQDICLELSNTSNDWMNKV